MFLNRMWFDMPKKRAAMIAATALVAVAAVTPASAKPPELPKHGYHTESFTDPNFCGTGATVVGIFESIFTNTERDGVFKTEHRGSTTFSYGGASVIVSFAGQFMHTLVGTGEGGLEVRLLTSKGIPIKIQLPNGPVLALEAGVIVQLVTIQNGNELYSQIVRINGPHPIAESDGSLFCAAVSQALGIT